jgi:hypothetical protein
MINDSNLAKYVNIIKSTREDLTEDVYTFMVIKVTEKIKDGIINNKISPKLGYLIPDRKFIKVFIMSIPYGATRIAICDKIKATHFQFHDMVDNKATYILLDNKYKNIDGDFYLFHTEIYSLAEIIHGILYDTFTNLKELVIYLKKKMNKFLKLLNLHNI